MKICQKVFLICEGRANKFVLAQQTTNLTNIEFVCECVKKTYLDISLLLLSLSSSFRSFRRIVIKYM